LDDDLGAFITVCEDRAYRAADRAQARIEDGTAGPLTGIPVALKDNFVTQGIRTTCASKILENWIPPYDGTAVSKLVSSGAVIVGKTNLDEFAMGASTEYSAFMVSRNPWDHSKVPGGSSGGSAAAVASGMATIAYGSDTGGSVRQPAALCGVVGMKPTYGRVSRFGLVAFASSLDQISPFARTVEDCIFAFEAVAGPDRRDPTTVDASYDAAIARTPALEGKRFALPKEMFSDAIDEGVSLTVLAGIESLASAGASIEEISLPLVDHGVSTYYIIAPAEASSNLARFDGVRYGLRIDGNNAADVMGETRTAGFGKEVKERIIIGTYVLSSGYYDAYYTKACQARSLMKQQFREAFQRFDGVITPTSPTVAFDIGERTGDALALKIADYCTIPANMGGFPAISVPCGTSSGLPVGLQLICDSFAEDKMFGMSLAIEELMPKIELPLGRIP
jgi:aspartyl-tRNA(Asn)/glutamyl-tRNA(Gln) amidotransferase subunit A